MTYAMARLCLGWLVEKQEVIQGRLDELLLPGHQRSPLVSLPFLPDLQNELSRLWEKPYSARVVTGSPLSYLNV